MAIMDKARARGAFKRPDIGGFIPKGMEDTVQRISAAGQKIMYSPDMREELMAEIQSEEAIPLKLAKAVVGLMLTLDQQAKGGGIPEEALFPAGLELLGEACDVLTQAGQQVTQEEYNEAARGMFVLMGQKLGIDQDQMMGAAEQAMGGADPAAQGDQAPADPENDPDDSQPGHEQSEAPIEEQAEDAGQEPDEEVA